MENGGGLSIADAMALGNNDTFGGSGSWVFFLFFLLAMGNNGFGNNCGCNCEPITCTTYQDRQDTAAIQRQMDTNSLRMQNDFGFLQAGQENIRDSVVNSGLTLNNTIRDGNYALQTVAMQNGFLTQQGTCDVIKAIDDCCCAQRLEACQNTNAIVNAIRDDGNATRALYNETRMRDLESQLNACQTETVVRAETDRILATQGRWCQYPPCTCNCCPVVNG